MYRCRKSLAKFRTTKLHGLRFPVRLAPRRQTILGVGIDILGVGLAILVVNLMVLSMGVLVENMEVLGIRVFVMKVNVLGVERGAVSHGERFGVGQCDRSL